MIRIYGVFVNISLLLVLFLSIFFCQYINLYSNIPKKRLQLMLFDIYIYIGFVLQNIYMLNKNCL